MSRNWSRAVSASWALAVLLTLCVSALPASAQTVAAEERWDSSFGPVTLQFLAAPGSAATIPLRGSWDQGGGQIGEIRSGTYDAATRVLEFTYYQSWNNQNGTGRFTLSSDGKSGPGTYSQGSGSGSWTLSRSQPSALAAPAAPAAAPPPTTAQDAGPVPVARPASDEVGALYDNWNRALVGNRPTAATVFRFDQSVLVTRITNYHWTDGRGAPPGTIALRSADGTLFGPWPARGTSGTGGAQNVNWVVEPDVVLLAGTYTVVDSDPGTWSHNAESAGRGFASVNGRLPSAPAAVPDAVRAAIAAQGYYEETWDSDWGLTTLYYLGIIDPPGAQLAVAGSWQQPSGMGACDAEEDYCWGQIDGGVFDLAPLTLWFKYYQPWNDMLGVGLLQLAPDGLSLSGSYTHDSGESGPWVMWRGEPSVALR
ncbi:MAG: hypothetical protein HY332_15570 [Chloroflexi bacterium]|nr:hypothetical protein [Chloroflexota bacterium]